MGNRPRPAASTSRITMRAYGSLNDFLPPSRRWRTWSYVVSGRPAVKDVVESLGIPHPEIDLLLANGRAVPFEYAVEDGDRITAYPLFETIDVSEATLVRAAALEPVRFVADGHLGRLARLLRLLGLDTWYDTRADDETLAQTASGEARTLLTRDVGLLKRRIVTHGYFVRSTDARRQLLEVIRRFRRLAFAPFTRCLACNTPLRTAALTEVASRVPPRAQAGFDRFQVCDGCGRVYWEGSHWMKLAAIVDEARRAAAGSPGR